MVAHTFNSSIWETEADGSQSLLCLLQDSQGYLEKSHLDKQKIIEEISPNLKKRVSIKVQGAQRIPNRQDAEKLSTTHNNQSTIYAE